MERIAVVSDSHVPDRESEIPAPFRERVRSADHTVHAGDFTSSRILDEFESLAGGDLTAVAGNVDAALGLDDGDVGVTVHEVN